ncbi:MAG: Gfo/Idh/MocA family oxidoreductase [Cyclobacteriaceae bacterium]|nr:Gfo/Idh/MocA family oxidoreductase [Cyclobacteriaceae bacterium]
MKKLRFAVMGCGFWSNFQIPGWLESDEVELVALYNRTLAKAEKVGERFGVQRIYDDPEALMANEELDFIDIITDVDTHLKFTEMAAQKGVHVVCQKPMAANYEDARKLVEVCKKHHVQLFINENFRWQAPIRKLKQYIDSGVIGRPFKGRVSFCSGFPVFDNQPFLKELDRFILTDVGSHILDICRFLFGEAITLQCLTQRVNPQIKGEDVANVFMLMENGVHCYAEMSYASILEKELFPQTLVLVEGEKGSIHLTADYEIRISTRAGTQSEIVKPVLYDWIDPEYAVVHSSIVGAQMDILKGLQGGPCETTGDDNFNTVRLVWASYYSADHNCMVKMEDFI